MSGADLDQELAEIRRRADGERFGRFSPHTLAWLALLPEWDDVLAIRLRLTKDPAALINALTDADLIETRATLGADGAVRTAFWVRRGVRADIGRYLRRDDSWPDAGFRNLIHACERARDEPAVREWLEIADFYADDPNGVGLVNEVDRLLASGRAVEAARMVAATQVIGEVLGGPLADAARRAQWRLDRSHRAELDRKALRHHVRQRAIESALDTLLADMLPADALPADAELADVLSADALLAETAEYWALHLLGDGGVGKTMAVRYLASGRYAADRNLPGFPVARVDFDHLDPRYPDRRPAELFLALGDELRGYEGRRTHEYARRTLADVGAALHEELAGSEPDQSRVGRLQREVVEAFARYLGGLGERVVLVLDTCEELAKLYAPGATAPAVDRTFEMLEALHAVHPGVRVILAGRRWLVPPPFPAATPRLSERPYLRVLRTDGFTIEEANAYLVRREATMLPGGLYGAILKRLRRSTPDGDRFNPFELASYVDWALSDPSLTATALRAASADAYIEQRIIGRIAEAEVRAALPVAVEFGRFDLALITPALRRAEIDPATAFAGVAAQEWVTVVETYEATGQPRVIEVDDHLRGRMRRVLTSSPAWPPVDEALLGRDAVAVVEAARTLGEVAVATVTAAVRLLPVAEAARFWQGLEERVVREDEWAWAGQVADRVAGIEAERLAASGDQGPTILAAVRATQAASRIHNSLPHDLVDLWRDADRWAAQYPDADTRERLGARAHCGRVAAGDDIELDEALLRLAPVDAAFAAHDAVAGRRDRPGQPPRLRRRPPLAADTYQDPAMRACAQIVNTVTELRTGTVLTPLVDPDIRGFADDAVAQAEAASRSTPVRWADWVPPRDLVDRVRLNWLMVSVPTESETTERWRDDGLGRIADIDAERVVARTVWLMRRSLAQSDLAGVAAAARYVPGRRPTHWLHDQVPPLVLVLTEVWLYQGEFASARTLLRETVDAAIAAGDDPETVERCRQALAQLPSAPAGTLRPAARPTEESATEYLDTFGSAGYGGLAYLRPDTIKPTRDMPSQIRLERLVYLVGTPVDTAGGWRFRVRADLSASTDRIAASETLLDLGEDMATNDLYVLHSEPVDGPAEPFGPQLAGFLAVARVVLGNRSRAVMLVPPLPDDVAKRVVDTVWHRAARPIPLVLPVPSLLPGLRRRLLARRVRRMTGGADVRLYTQRNPPPDEESA